MFQMSRDNALHHVTRLAWEALRGLATSQKGGDWIYKCHTIISTPNIEKNVFLFGLQHGPKINEVVITIIEGETLSNEPKTSIRSVNKCFFVSLSLDLQQNFNLRCSMEPKAINKPSTKIFIDPARTGICVVFRPHFVIFNGGSTRCLPGVKPRIIFRIWAPVRVLIYSNCKTFITDLWDSHSRVPGQGRCPWPSQLLTALTVSVSASLTSIRNWQAELCLHISL